METVGLYNVLPYGYATSGIAGKLCSLFDGKLCDFVMSLVADEDPTIDDSTRYDVYLSNLPAGAGYRNIVHYGQLIDHKEEEFVRYDHGKVGNVERYG